MLHFGSIRPVRLRALLFVGFALLSIACEDDDESRNVADATIPDDDDDAGTEDVRCDALDPESLDDLPACEGKDTDYAPDADDEWAACVSDDGEYQPIESSISTVARVEAFEQIAELLLGTDEAPSSDDFLEARMLYQQEEGLDSRVVRRYDPHVDVPAGTDCAESGVPEMYPDYCVGPARLQPILLDAFNAGVAGEAPREQAARIEAALLHFLYVSTFKESLTCTDVPKDCDSSYAYYTGGESARDGIGLARYVRAAAPDAHDAAWDGLLAVRCWRDLDDAVPAEDLELRDRAREQYDRAVLRGLAAVLRERLQRLGTAACDEAQQADYAFAETLAPLLDGAVRARDEDAADALRAALSPSPLGRIDPEAAIAALDATIACP